MARCRSKCISMHKGDLTFDDAAEYVSEVLQHAREVRSTPGILEPKENDWEEVERLKTLAGGLPVLSNLRYHPFVQGQDLEVIRQGFDTIVPCRIGSCSRSTMLCCGVCIYPCVNRCALDVLHKVCMYAYNIYMGTISREEATAKERACFDIIMAPNTTYRKLVNSVSDLGDLRWDYAPQIDKYDRKVDSETGQILYTEWPNAGLCPYCIPATTVVRTSETTRAKRAENAIRKSEEYNRRISREVKRGRPRKGESRTRGGNLEG